MPTNSSTDTRRTSARRFVLRAVGWSVGLFGLIRLSLVEEYLVLPLTQWQAHIAERAFGVPVHPVAVTLACSGADALALCVGFILAFPASWPRRLAGASGGIFLILALNTIRIGTLGRAANSPAFDTLHLYVWPAVLMVAIAAYVFTWMHLTIRQRGTGLASPARLNLPGATPRFVWVTIVFLTLFTAAAPLYLSSTAVATAAAFTARAAAWILRGLGIEAVAAANVLLTAGGGFLVTQECISTPLIPVYLASVVAVRTRWRWRVVALLATVPLFVALSIARLLVVAVPASLIESPLPLVHAFYQLLLAAVLIGLVAAWRHGRSSRAWQRAILGVAVAFGTMYLLAIPYAAVLAWAFGGAMPIADPQGALGLLPVFQVGLYFGLVTAALVDGPWRIAAAGLAVLLVLQVATFAVLAALGGDAWFAPHSRDVRAWAVLAPLLTIIAVVSHARSRR